MVCVYVSCVDFYSIRVAGCLLFWFSCCFFQAEDGIRDLVRSRGLGDVYKRQVLTRVEGRPTAALLPELLDRLLRRIVFPKNMYWDCLLYTSDAADDLLCVDLGGRRIIKKKT